MYMQNKNIKIKIALKNKIKTKQKISKIIYMHIKGKEMLQRKFFLFCVNVKLFFSEVLQID